MAKITIVGEAVVVTSEIKMEDLKKVAKYRPEALIVYRDDEKKEPIFRVGVARGASAGCISKLGAEFGSVAHDGSGKATITLTLANVNDDSDIKEIVAEQVGVGILHLNKVEEMLPGVIAEIDAEHDNIISNISVM